MNTQIIIVIGSGGVGKTTTAAAIGWNLSEQNKKVLVMTIDPSQRLKSVLGIGHPGQITEVRSGTLWAMLIDHAQVFSDFVGRAAQSQPGAEKIKNNRLYQKLTTELSGSQDFSSCEALYTQYESGNFEYIVLDTPPADHAIHFLKAPAKIAALFSNKVFKLFNSTSSSGFLTRLLQTGTQQIYLVLKTLTGSQFLDELHDFFKSLEKWQDKLEARTLAIHRLLQGPDTQFYLVTSLEPERLAEAEYLHQQVKRSGYNLATLIINRAILPWQKDDPKQILNKEHSDLLSSILQKLQFKLTGLAAFKQKLTGDLKVIELPELDSNQDLLKNIQLLSQKVF